MLRNRLRDVQIFWIVSRGAILVLGVLVVGSALLFHFCYADPGTGEHPDFSLALYAAFALIFFETVLPYPEQGFFQILFFVLPILGLTTVIDGVLQIGSTLLSRRSRGQKWQAAMASTHKNHIIICGAGKVGYRVILELMKFDQRIVAIEHNPDGRFVENIHDLGVPLLFQDASNKESLIKAGIRDASAIVPCTDDELRNLDIALEARELHPEIKVVMRMFDADLARRVEKGFGIHTAFSTSALAAPVFASAAMQLDVKHSFYVEDRLLIISEIVVADVSSLHGMAVGELEEAYDLSVVCSVIDGTAELHPEGTHTMVAGEKLLILSSRESMEEVQQLNRPL